MRTLRVSALSLCLLFGAMATASAQMAVSEDHSAAQLTVTEAVITTSVEDRQPTDNLTTVTRGAGHVYCWTRISGAQVGDQIDHVWYWNDDEMARIPLHIGSANWRTWSSKNIVPEWTGEWRVDVVAADGTVLDSVSFTVQ